MMPLAIDNVIIIIHMIDMIQFDMVMLMVDELMIDNYYK